VGYREFCPKTFSTPGSQIFNFNIFNSLIPNTTRVFHGWKYMQIDAQL
jgi:hypothetical protein